MSRARFLIDTSVLSRQHLPSVAQATALLADAGLIAVCAPVMFEIGVTARNARDHEFLMIGLSVFSQVAISEVMHREALDVQAALATRGTHRSASLVDTLVATAAVAHGLTVLHHDADFELLAEITGCAQQWIVPRGTADPRR